ncbi:MAG: ankyrin repeat domain-containing protein [Armatimonadota bacterium]|jgi:hypothetical protein
METGKTFTAELNGTTYRIEWLTPEHCVERPPPAILGGPGRPSQEGDYGGHIEAVYNMQEDIPPGDVDPEDFRDDAGELRFGDYWGHIAASLAGKVAWFSFMAFDGKMPAGKLRFFPKTVTVPRWVGWEQEEHRRDWTDEILWLGAAYVDPRGVEDGLDGELVRCAVHYARAAGFQRIEATGCSEVRTYAQWAEVFPASVYAAHGFATIAWGCGSPDAFEHMVNGCHGPRSRELARAAIEAGVHPDAAHRCPVMALDLTGEAKPEAEAPEPPRDGFTTPLHEGVRQDHLPTTEWLLEKNANANAKDHQGCTPLELAKTEEMKALLRRYGAEP